jgi:hypothetical protein
MTDSPPALRHYQHAIRALSDGTYSGLSEAERTKLLRVLHDEQTQLLRRRLDAGDAIDEPSPDEAFRAGSSD